MTGVVKNNIMKIFFLKPILFFVALMFFNSCQTVRLISEYDEITDKATTSLQEKVSKYFVKLERAIGTDNARYEKFKDFFEDTQVDINTLQVRAAAIDKNEIVIEQINLIQKMLNNLEALHKLGFNSMQQITPLKQPFNAAFTAIIKLQMGLKRGEKTRNN